MPHHLEHLEPFVAAVNQPKGSQPGHGAGKPQFAGAPQLQQHRQPHGKERQAVDKIDVFESGGRNCVMPVTRVLGYSVNQSPVARHLFTDHFSGAPASIHTLTRANSSGEIKFDHAACGTPGTLVRAPGVILRRRLSRRLSRQAVVSSSKSCGWRHHRWPRPVSPCARP